MNKVAVVGRPNVGKSTLVNRLVGKRETIVQERPGVTRDRRQLTVKWAGGVFDIIDTGGWTVSSKGKTAPTDSDMRSLEEKISKQSELAIEEADVIVLVVDATTGVTNDDDTIARMVKASGKPALVICNKVDHEHHVGETWQFLALGLGDPYPISALHGLGTGEVLDSIFELFPDAPVEEEEHFDDDSFRVAIAGRPNVGKSTLFNRLCGSERVIVHDMAGTTRDPVDTEVQTELGPLTFVDTAGLKRQARQADETEYYSSLRSFAAIDRADCVLFIVDGTEGVTHFDMRLLERIDASGCALVILLNKWDTLDTEQRLEVQARAKRDLGFVNYAPVLTMSALSGKHVDKIIPALFAARESYEQRIPTAELNKVIHQAQISHPHPSRSNRRVKILYATQGAANPPTFTIFATQSLDDSYLRYLENTLRDKFDFGSTAIKLRVRKKNA
jgi:GTP-binding protein